MTAEDLLFDRRVDDAGTVHLRVEGEVDVASSDLLAKELANATAEGRNVEVNLAAVPFMDSSGIGVLVTAHRTLADIGGILSITGVTATVQRALAHAGLTEHLLLTPETENGPSA